MTDRSWRTNQHKPCPPAREIQEPAQFYFTLNMSDVDIVCHLKDHYDQEEYGLSVVSFRRMRNSCGWKWTRQQQHILESIEQHAIRRDLRQQFSFHVPRELIAKLLKITEPNAVEARRRGCLKRRRFLHDKWLRFGLWLHISLDPFTGWINWLKVWWTNKNPRLIARYYLDCCRKLGDPALDGTLQHRWMRKHQNIKPEIMWSVLRRDFAPGFENILEEGAELDAWAHRRNHNAPRRDKNKILPHGILAIICAKPREFNSLDFKVPVPSALFDEVEAIYAPPDHPVSDLMPPSFEQRAQYLYTSLGKPQVSSDSFWNVYQMLLAQFLAIEGEDDLTVLLSQGVTEPEDENDWGPQGEHQDDEDQPEFAEFTDFESESDGPK
ncbi:hypothetical protein DFJ58DRAFT_719387 [Suillus subalutaceus]|uniref:uncharacterized protein n=1 Tax=Suillus subalutaceus TaxID=48586 RepID=UPI001B87663D|nr:uncharacterized protein DFJ58DRAFT_719387 [Suillus subalutaceus]KAG1834010.1 hypothetical protein DFJ58DRAFT_719387 [Suillus subalutaceus]